MMVVPKKHDDSGAYVSAHDALRRVRKIIPSTPMAWEWLSEKIIRSEIGFRAERQRVLCLGKTIQDGDIIVYEGDGMRFWPVPADINDSDLDHCSIHTRIHTYLGPEGLSIFRYCDGDELMISENTGLTTIDWIGDAGYQLQSFNVLISDDHIAYWCDEKDEPIRMLSSPEENMRPARPRGAPRRYDWDGALIYMIGMANTPDGLPTGSQAEIEKMLLEWFSANGMSEPATATVRPFAQRIRDEILKRR